MIKEPYKDIPEKYASVVKSLLSASDEYHRVHARRMARTLQTFAESNPTGKLLEVGTSHLIPLAIKELELDVEVSVTDFDLSKPYSGKMECSLNNKTVEVDVYRVNIEESTIPVPDETFDVVLLCEVLEHMEVDPMFMLSEINRITKQGGKLILTTPNSTSSRNIHKILNGYEPYFYMQYRHDRSLYRHNYEYSLPTLKSVMRSAGFEEELIYPLFADTNVQKKAVMHGHGLKAIYNPPMFHINHGSKGWGGGGIADGINKKSNDQYRAIMYQKQTENTESWGFGDTEIEFEVF